MEHAKLGKCTATDKGDGNTHYNMNKDYARYGAACTAGSPSIRRLTRVRAGRFHAQFETFYTAIMEGAVEAWMAEQKESNKDFLAKGKKPPVEAFTTWLRERSATNECFNYWARLLTDFGFRYLFGLYCQRENLGACVLLAARLFLRLLTPQRLARARAGHLAHDLQCSMLPEMWLFGHTRMTRTMLRVYAHQQRMNETQWESFMRNYCVQGVTGAQAVDLAQERCHGTASQVLRRCGRLGAAGRGRARAF